MISETLTFGKYKGWVIADVPGQYLAWVLRNCRRLDPWIRRCVEAELDSRLNGDDDGLREPPRNDQVREVLTKWYREMSLRFHPDRDGSHQAMTAINAANDRLRELFGFN